MAGQIEKTMSLFNKVEEDGSFGGIKLAVFRYICSNQGLTVGEIYNRYSRDNPDLKKRSRAELAKRVNELFNIGVIKKVGSVICPYSKRRAARWVASGSIPRFETDEKGRQRLLTPKRPVISEDVEPQEFSVRTEPVVIVVPKTEEQLIIVDDYRLELMERDADALLVIYNRTISEYKSWRRFFRSKKSDNELIMQMSALARVLDYGTKQTNRG